MSPDSLTPLGVQKAAVFVTMNSSSFSTQCHSLRCVAAAVTFGAPYALHADAGGCGRMCAMSAREPQLLGERVAQGMLSLAPQQRGGIAQERREPSWVQAGSPLAKLAISGAFITRRGGHGNLGCKLLVSGRTAAVAASRADPAPCAGTLCLMWVMQWMRDQILLKKDLGTRWEMVVLKQNQLPNLARCTTV